MVCSPADAVHFGTGLQMDLLNYPWPAWLLEDAEVAACPPASISGGTELA